MTTNLFAVREPERKAGGNPLTCAVGSLQGALSRELGATLATTCGKDGAADAGRHALTETVGLSATTIVRLESALRSHG